MSKNVFVINEKCQIKTDLKEEDFEPFIRQNPNRKLLGITPIYLHVWNFADKRKKEKRFNTYLREVVGEEPVVFEPVLMNQSVDQLSRMLGNNGYFDSQVTADTSSTKKRKILWDKRLKKKVIITYGIETEEAYRLNSIRFVLENPDSVLISQLKDPSSNLQHAELKVGERFKVDDFESERDRIAKVMKNLGYFTFDNVHVLFDVDTALGSKRFETKIRFRNLRTATQINGQDSVIISAHQRFKINNIIVNEEFSGTSNQTIELDTIIYEGVTFLVNKKPRVKVARLYDNIFISSGDEYSLDKTNYTYQRLNALGVFKFIDMRYEPAGNDGDIGLLDLRINLTHAPKQSVTLEGTGTNRSGNLGLSLGLNLKNRNIFRGAEQLDWKIYSGVEAQRSNSTLNNDQIDFITSNTPFNTYELGTQVVLTVPDFISITNDDRLPWFKEPRTNIKATVDRQVRPQFNRILINTAYEMNMRIRERDLLAFAPIDLSYIDLNKDPEFQKQLDRTGNALLINSYNNHIIPAGRLSYSHTTQEFSELENFFRYKVNFESAGNLLRAASAPLNLKYDSERNSYLIDNIAFAQYVKLDVDYATYYTLTEHTNTAYRLISGVGLPLANLNALPFDRSFFAGGANDVRAWQARALGPGSLADTATFGLDQVGDIKLELNLEYRFKIIDFLEGAMFLDLGNIWMIEKDEQRPGANFDWSRFYKEIAVGPGVGARLNFGFFKFRLDGGLQVKDPSLPEGERWIFQPKVETNARRAIANTNRLNVGLEAIPNWTPGFTINLGIDYPF